MHIVGVYNIKGGVGKTSTAVNLAYLAARYGLRTLVWALDPQGAASFYFRIKPKVKGGSKKMLRGKMDLLLDQAKKPAVRLLKLLRPLSYEYDLVFLGCPPSISMVSENVFQATDALLLPTIPTTLPLRTYRQLLDFVSNNGLERLRIMPFFSMVDRRKRMHMEMLEQLPDHYDELLTSSILYASDVERMGVYRQPLLEFAPKGVAAVAYEALWAEVREALRL